MYNPSSQKMEISGKTMITVAGIGGALLLILLWSMSKGDNKVEKKAKTPDTTDEETDTNDEEEEKVHSDINVGNMDTSIRSSFYKIGHQEESMGYGHSRNDKPPSNYHQINTNSFGT